jgi:hypothetical protein
MRDTFIMAATVGACALIGNVVGGYVIASRLSQLAAAPATVAALAGPSTSAEIAYSRRMADPSSRRHRG